MKLLRTLALLLCLSPVAADAAGLWWHGGKLENLESGSTSCTPTTNDGVSGDHSYVTRDCPDSGTAGFVGHGPWIPGMPTTGTVPVTLEAKPAENGDVCIEVRLGCPGGSGSNVYGTASKQSVTLGSTAFSGVSFAEVDVSAGANPWAYCTLRVRRIKGDETCTDDVTGAVKFRSAGVNND